ncbi:MAG: trigger factor [Victivallales bacterium]|nr:trigger factor [Victivallales bacterium]
MSENLKAAIELKCSEVQPGQVKAEYKVARQAIGAEAAEVARGMVDYVQVPGFRKGKAPVKMVMVKYLPQIKDELMRKVMGAAMDKFADEQGTEAVAFNLPEGGKFPELELDQDLALELLFDVAPQFEVPEYRSLKVNVAPKEISDADIDERIEAYKKMYAEYQDIPGPAAREDMLQVAYTSDFVLPEDASATLKRQAANEESWLWLNEPEVIPGGIAALIGAEVGKEYSFAAVYPEDYREAELAGKTVNYQVRVNKMQRREPIADIAGLCAKMNLENEAKLREQISASLAIDAKNKAAGETREKIQALLEEKVGPLVIPPTLMAQETQKELRRIANNLVKTEADAEKFKADISKHKAAAEEAAKNKLTRFFIMQKIAKKEDIKVNENEVDLQIKGMSRYYGLRANDLRKVMEENGGMDDLQEDLLTAKVLDFLAKQIA